MPDLGWLDPSLLNHCAETDEHHFSVRQSVYAAMETGHHMKARDILSEYEQTYPEHAARLRLSLVRDFGMEP